MFTYFYQKVSFENSMQIVSSGDNRFCYVLLILNAYPNCKNALLESSCEQITIPHQFSQLGWLSIPDRLRYNKAVLTYRAINNLSPEYITQLIKPVSEVHTLSLRSSENGSLYVPKARTALFDGFFSCSAPRLWNALPQTVKTSGSLSIFKQSLKATF